MPKCSIYFLTLPASILISPPARQLAFEAGSRSRSRGEAPGAISAKYALDAFKEMALAMPTFRERSRVSRRLRAMAFSAVESYRHPLPLIKRDCFSSSALYAIAS